MAGIAYYGTILEKTGQFTVIEILIRSPNKMIEQMPYTGAV